MRSQGDGPLDRCARTEARVRRNRRIDRHMQRFVTAEMFLHHVCVTTCAFGIRAGRLAAQSAPHSHGRHEIADRKPDAAKAASQTAIQIEKPEMQPRRNSDGRARRSLHRLTQTRTPEVSSTTGF